jgi:hypothetical protein
LRHAGRFKNTFVVLNTLLVLTPARHWRVQSGLRRYGMEFQPQGSHDFENRIEAWTAIT